MAGDLFQDLPPPSALLPPQVQLPELQSSTTIKEPPSSQLPAPPPPALKSALKRTKPPSSQEEIKAPELKSALKRPKPQFSHEEIKPQDSAPGPAPAPGRRLRFKTTTDASKTQVIEAMQKIASHIKNASKFNKASKLAIQLIQAGSVKHATSDYFFAILEGAMSSPSTCNDALLRADYHALFSAAQDAVECLNKQQKNLLTIWKIRAVIANDLFTDDSFVFSKASGKIKEAISSLPVATKDDDEEEAAALEEIEVGSTDGESSRDNTFSSSVPDEKEEEPDPFGLDALMPCTSKNDDKAKGKRELVTKIKRSEEEEARKFLSGQREALVSCLEIAARRYKIPWCQTVIDILVKHAFDNISRFTSRQRDAINKLWASIKEQQIRRKQGKSVSGKLDVNGFEWLQEKYANEKISIRHSVGGGGERSCEQWLG